MRSLPSVVALNLWETFRVERSGTKPGAQRSLSGLFASRVAAWTSAQQSQMRSPAD
jgi:hypothetical protein